MTPGIFSRENDRYGATICVDDTCHADPKRVTAFQEYTRKFPFINSFYCYCGSTFLFGDVIFVKQDNVNVYET